MKKHRPHDLENLDADAILHHIETPTDADEIAEKTMIEAFRRQQAHEADNTDEA